MICCRAQPSTLDASTSSDATPENAASLPSIASPLGPISSATGTGPRCPSRETGCPLTMTSCRSMGRCVSLSKTSSMLPGPGVNTPTPTLDTASHSARCRAARRSSASSPSVRTGSRPPTTIGWKYTAPSFCRASTPVSLAAMKPCPSSQPGTVFVGSGSSVLASMHVLLIFQSVFKSHWASSQRTSKSLSTRGALASGCS